MSIHSGEWREFRFAANGSEEWRTVQPPTPADPVDPVTPSVSPQGTTLGYALFATRWLQAPLYFGLVAAQGVYVYKFFNELWTLIVRCVSGSATETYVMLAVLKLVDVVMIANLLIMTIVGGYETFVSRIGLQGHRDQPEWLSHVNSNVLKVKLATAIVGISSVHLLQMFVDVHHTSHHALLWGTVIHMAFIASAVLLAYMSGPMLREDKGHGSHHGSPQGAARRPEAAAGPTAAERNPRSRRSRHPGAGPADGDRPGPRAPAAAPVLLQDAAADPGPGHLVRELRDLREPGLPLRDPVHAGRDAARAVRGPAHADGPAWPSGAEAGVEGRVRAAGFPARKLLEEFDEGHPRSFDRRCWRGSGRWTSSPPGGTWCSSAPPAPARRIWRSGSAYGPATPGTGCCSRPPRSGPPGWPGARAEGRLAEELAALDACPLLIVDEVGYLPFDADTARLFFQLVAHRYERASLVVTSDRPLGRWEEIFGGAAPAMVDRLAHHAEIVRLEGDSYRLRRATSAG